MNYKNLKKYIVKILPVFIISIALVFVHTKFIKPIEINYNHTDISNDNQKVYFVDLDKDGYQETITFFLYENINQPTIKVFSEKNFRNYWIFPDDKVELFEILFADYDNDGITEMFSFTQSNDSVFIYGMDLNEKYEFFLKRKFVYKIQKYYNKLDYRIYYLGVDDVDNDSINELYFTINAAYSLHPRKVFRLNLANNKLDYSNKSGVSILPFSQLFDIDNSKTKEIVLSTFASSNYSDSIDYPYKDDQSWLMLLNSNFENVFEPIPFNGAPSTVISFPYNYKNKLNIGVLYSDTEHGNIELLVYNNKGKQIAKKKLPDLIYRFLASFNSNNQIILYNTNTIIEFNNKLEIIKEINIDNNNLRKLIMKDINFDGEKEIICCQRNRKIIIYNKDLQKIGESTMPKDVNVKRISVKKCFNNATRLIFHTPHALLYFDIKKDKVYPFRFVIYSMIILVVFFIWYIIPYLFKKNKGFNKRKNNYYNSKLQNIYDNYEDSDSSDDKINNIYSILKNINSNSNINSRQKVLLKLDESFDSALKLFSGITNDEYYSRSFYEYIEKIIVDSSINADYIIDYDVSPKFDFSYIEDSKKIEGIIILFEIFKIINNSSCESIFLQVIKHSSYINIFSEISCGNSDFTKKNNNRLEKLESLLVLLKGNYDCNKFDNKVILNIDISLEIFEEENDFLINTNKIINVAIAEDHEVTIFGLETRLKQENDINLVGSGRNGKELLELLKTKKVDVLITDIAMPEMNGIKLSSIVKKEYPQIKIIVFTMYLENWFVEKLKKNGVKAYVSKNSKLSDLVYAIHKANNNEYFYCSLFKEKMKINNGDKIELKELSLNEIIVLRSFRKNLDTKKMSDQLLMSEKSVNTYFKNIILKLNLSSRNSLYSIIEKSNIF